MLIVKIVVSKRLEVLPMKNMDFRNADFFDTIVTQKIEGTELLLARKKTILPERKILVEKPTGISLSQY